MVPVKVDGSRATKSSFFKLACHFGFLPQYPLVIYSLRFRLGNNS